MFYLIWKYQRENFAWSVSKEISAIELVAKKRVKENSIWMWNFPSISLVISVVISFCSDANNNKLVNFEAENEMNAKILFGLNFHYSQGGFCYKRTFTWWWRLGGSWSWMPSEILSFIFISFWIFFDYVNALKHL